ncbi:MAG: DUF5916 domain-containing protein [Candidatus Eisenbacteria bacterium]
MSWERMLACAALACLALIGPIEAEAGYEAFRPTPNQIADAAAMTTDSASPVIRAIKLDGRSVQVDGKLDEDFWRDAPSGERFTVNEPDRGKAPSEQTVFKVAYDDDAIYFGVACWERDPRNITAHLSRRDRFSDSDLVSVYVDPYDDNTTGYNFRVNPLGVQADAYIYDDGNRDDDWDAVWESEVSRDKDGWYAELKIPFSSIRYRSGAEMNWGLEVYRYMHGRGEDTAWVTWDREQRGFVSRFGTLSGLRDVPAPRQLEIVPYVVAVATDPSTIGKEDRHANENFGADLKYGVTSDLTLNATVQPDFGQVEADPANLNLSPFETFYSEKRPFFVEGSRFFQLNGFNLFYSRRIGTGDENSRIRFAGKLTGKAQGNVSLGVLAAVTDVTQEGQSHNFLKSGDQLNRYLVTRVGKEWRGGTLRVNVMQTAVQRTASRAAVGNYDSREAYTSGLDWNWDFHDRRYNFSGFTVGSIIAPEALADRVNADRKRYGTGGGFDLSQSGGKLHYGTWGRWESDRLDLNDVGFLSSPDEVSSGFWSSYNYNPDSKDGRILSGNLNLNFNRSWLYADRTGFDTRTGERAWGYGPGHPTSLSGNVNGGRSSAAIRSSGAASATTPLVHSVMWARGGPLLKRAGRPPGFWVGRRPTAWGFRLSTDFNDWWDVAQDAPRSTSTPASPDQSSAISTTSLSYGHRADTAQYLDPDRRASRGAASGSAG